MIAPPPSAGGNAGNPLTTALLQSIGRARGFHEALCMAIALLREREQQNNRLRETNAHLRAQLRAFLTGRPIVAERRAIDFEDETGSVAA